MSRLEYVVGVGAALREAAPDPTAGWFSKSPPEEKAMLTFVKKSMDLYKAKKANDKPAVKMHYKEAETLHGEVVAAIRKEPIRRFWSVPSYVAMLTYVFNELVHLEPQFKKQKSEDYHSVAPQISKKMLKSILKGKEEAKWKQLEAHNQKLQATSTGTVFDLFFRDANGEFHPMPATYDDDCEKFVFRQRPTVTEPAPAPAPAPAPEVSTFDFATARAKISDDDVVGLEKMLEESRGFARKTRANTSQGAWLLKHAMEHYKVDAVKLLLDRFATTEEMRRDLVYAAGKMQEPYDPLMLAATMYVTNRDAGAYRGMERSLDLFEELMDKKFKQSDALHAMLKTMWAKSPRDALVRIAYKK